MNKNFISKFMALVMLGYCCSIANTMESDNDVSSIKSTEEKTSVSGSVFSVNNMDNGPRVEYEPDKMWFDYQALFDKTKSVVLGQNIDIEIKHTDFKTNKLLLKIISNNNLLNDILDGNIEAQNNLLYMILDYLGETRYRNSISTNRLLQYNYCCLLGITSSLCDLDTDHYIIRKQYLNIARYIPYEFDKRNISETKFYNIMKPLFEEISPNNI